MGVPKWIFRIIDLFGDIQNKQESPPAWTQEAYRPRHIKYSICYPVRGGVHPPVEVTPTIGVTPSQVWWGYLRWGTPQPGPTGEVPKVGYPLARSDGGTQSEYPHRDTPQPGPMGYQSTWGGVPPLGVPPSQVQLGYPRWGSPHQGIPSQVQPGGYPRWGTPRQGYPSGWTWLGYPPPPGPGWGTPLGVDRQNDGQTRVKTLPSRRTTYAVGKYTK